MGKENRTILRIQQLAHIERSIRSGKPTVEPGIWYVHGIPKPAGVSAQIVLKEYKKTEEDFRVLN
ncbi:hypothetical protein HY405_02345, partial [Candidatus Microgenomates bacterium]|nr:hypothetical protein [Candidatus Microgenomates bacterium]